MTGEEMIWDLWRKCLLAAREEGSAPAEAVQNLIQQSREILTDRGCSEDNANGVLFDIYTVIHWDWPEPTDRVFEGLLDIELTEYFAARGIIQL